MNIKYGQCSSTGICFLPEMTSERVVWEMHFLNENFTNPGSKQRSVFINAFPLPPCRHQGGEEIQLILDLSTGTCGLWL
jgi:hypothetical protein